MKRSSLTSMSRVSVLCAGLLLLSMAVMSQVARAQVILRCQEKDHAFHPTNPKTHQPVFNDVDLVSNSIHSSDERIAHGHPGRVGIGTDGAISIDAEGRPGTATITYDVRDRSTARVQAVSVAVQVNCPTPTPTPTPTRTRTGKEEPVRRPTISLATPTHRVPACDACREQAAALNKVSDELAQAQRGGNAQLIAILEAKVKTMTKELDACEKETCRRGTK